jgi:hypothetical protein
LLERPSLDTRSCILALNGILSVADSRFWLNGEVSSQTRPTSDAACFSNSLSQRVLGGDVEVVAHETAIAQQAKPSTLLPPGEQLMTVISLLGVFDSFFIVSPEALDASCAFDSVPLIITPSPLNTSGHIVPVPIPHRFERKELEAA